MKKYIVFDIGGTAIKYGVINEYGNLLEKNQTSTEAHKGGMAIVEKLKQIIKDYVNQFEIEGIAISTAGMVCPKEGKIVFSGPTIPNYTGTELKKIIETEFGLRCSVENDVNCAALGELWQGAGKEASSIVCLTIGTGLGGAIVLDGQVVNGSSYAAGEIGYMIVDGQPVQNLASAKSLVENVCQRKGISEGALTGRDVFDAYLKKDRICVEEIQKFVDYLAIAIANVTYMVNPQKVILGGGVMVRSEIIHPLLEEALKKYMLPSLLEKTEICYAQLGNNAGMIGALYHYKKSNH